ncbi:MAG: hypothetical protein QNJ18_11155 [Xenococcaceae cyanobacterium MO_167.B52]|nr:hypothetical protein [Xenococcaceae cyanobacterium MO_167.B52]
MANTRFFYPKCDRAVPTFGRSLSASYNPWVGLYWLVSGKTVAGMPIYSDITNLRLVFLFLILQKQF